MRLAKVAARCLITGLAGLLLTAQLGAANAQQPVDLELALLVDVSASVNEVEFSLQAQGLAAALRDPAVLETIRLAAPAGVAVAVMQWANAENQTLSVGWRRLANAAEIDAFASQIEAMPRLTNSGHTAISNAILFALDQLETNAFVGQRRVIDISGDGRNNDGFRLIEAREAAIARGVTINGLPILNELPLLDQYFRDYVIAGSGAFFIVARDYPDFAAAMTQKLIQEIGANPITRAPADNGAGAAKQAALEDPSRAQR